MRKGLKRGLAVLLIGLVGFHLYRNLSQLDWRSVSVSPGWAMAALLAFFAHMATLVACWKAIGTALGVKQDMRFALMAWGFALYGKFVPGRVARYVAVAATYRERGVPVAVSGAMLGLEVVASVSGFLLLTMLASSLATTPLAASFRFFAWGAIVLGLAALHPRVLNAVIALGRRVFRRSLDPIPCSYGTLLGLVFGYVVAYAFLCASNDFFLRAVGVHVGLFDSSALFGFAALAGMFALFAPSGIGAREAVLQLGLQTLVGGATASLATVVSRVGITLGELVFVVAPATAWFLQKRRDRHPVGAD